MNIYPKHKKEFYNQLINSKRLDLLHVIDIFSDKASSINADIVRMTLRELEGENIFTVVRKDSPNESVFIDEALFDSPEDYQIISNGFFDDDIEKSSSFKLNVEQESVTQLEENNHIVVLKPWLGTRIIGDYTQSANRYERLRAFTQLFANLLIQKKYSQLEKLISSRVVDQYSADYFSSRIQQQETLFGEFDFFDHLRVEQVYEGKGSNKKYFDDMTIPSGIALSDRVGVSSFKLISLYSPNGIMHINYSLFLSVIEEEGCYRVCGFEWSEDD